MGDEVDKADIKLGELGRRGRREGREMLDGG